MPITTTQTHQTKDSTEDMEDSIVVGEKFDLQPVKKAGAGDPFTYICDLHKPHLLNSSSPSPAPKPDRKPATELAVKEASGLKFDVSVPGCLQGGKQDRKASDNIAHAIEAVEVPQPTTKAGNDKDSGKEPVAKIQEGSKVVKEKNVVDLQSEVMQDHFEVAALELKESEDIMMLGTMANPLDEQNHKETGNNLWIHWTLFHVFTTAADAPDADDIQPLVETDHIRIEPDVVEIAPVTFKAPPKSAASLSTYLITKQFISLEVASAAK